MLLRVLKYSPVPCTMNELIKEEDHGARRKDAEAERHFKASSLASTFKPSTSTQQHGRTICLF